MIMNQLDVYYRAFTDYRKQTLDVRECIRQRKTFKNSNVELDKLEAVKYLITIEEDWVKAIEDGLVHVEKAVREERQFIRTNGEMVPIEKVKKVSKNSVEHLARHSNLITHVPENPGDTIIPDQLYIVEKLSDYAVYENRFLYMLLCYLRDFIDLRLEKIQNYRMKYIAEMSMSKKVETEKRIVSYETKFYEERKDNPYPLPDQASKDMLYRIESCQRVVLALLNTPLMAEVAKTPMVKPPIVKTNVLKMNNNFKNSLALYDFVASYKKQGFEVEEVKTDFVPFTDRIADELAEIINLTCFLTYKYGNDLEKLLKQSYEEEEFRRQQEEAEKLVQQLKQIKKRIAEEGYSIEEYLLLLEKRNKMLEKDSEDLVRAHNEISLLNKKVDELIQEKEELNRKIIELQETIEEKIKEIEYLNQKYIEDMAALKKQHEIEIAALNEAHQNKVEALVEQHESEIAELNEAHQKEIFDLEKVHLAEIERIRLNEAENKNRIIAEWNGKVSKVNKELADAHLKQQELTTSYSVKIKNLNDQIATVHKEREVMINEYEDKLYTLENNFMNEQNIWNLKYKKLTSEKDLAFAELRALRIEHNLINPLEDFTSRERFAELEHEFEIFNKFFKEQWALTKKSIRKMLLWTKEEKKQGKNVEKVFTKELPMDDEEEVQVKEDNDLEVEEQTDDIEDVPETDIEDPILIEEENKPEEELPILTEDDLD